MLQYCCSTMAKILFRKLLLLCLVAILLHGCQGSQSQLRTTTSGYLNRGVPVQTDALACATSSSNKTNWALVTTREGYQQWIYASADIVSDSMLKGGQWESAEAAQLDWALTQTSTILNQAGVGDSQHTVFLDVGANVGVFSLRYAHKGYKVLAFEAMEENAKMMQASLCANTAFAGNVNLMNLGLSSSRGMCYIISGDNNVGDGATICADSVEKVQAQMQLGYSIRGNMSIDRLDAVLYSLQHQGHLTLHKTTFVMKMDTEGHEYEVMRGSTKLLTEGLVWYILAEYAPLMLGSAPSGLDSPRSYLHLMHGLGYNISRTAFTGPFELPEQIYTSVPNEGIINLFMSLRENYRKPQLPPHA